MVSMGKPYSRYMSFNDAVSLTIFIAIDNAQFVKFITEVQDKNSKNILRKMLITAYSMKRDGRYLLRLLKREWKAFLNIHD